MTRWLSVAEQRVWREFRSAVDMLSDHIEAQLQQDSGMPLAYYEVLVTLSESPDRTMRMSDLALRCRSSRSRLSHAVARLEKDGWVRRETCPTDGRGSFATLTPEGFAALETAAPGHVEAVRQAVFDALTTQQVLALGEISTAIHTRLGSSKPIR
jgi:DNA-binding MarR family transcriptional regulator